MCIVEYKFRLYIHSCSCVFECAIITYCRKTYHIGLDINTYYVHIQIHRERETKSQKQKRKHIICILICSYIYTRNSIHIYIIFIYIYICRCRYRDAQGQHEPQAELDGVECLGYVSSEAVLGMTGTGT